MMKTYLIAILFTLIAACTTLPEPVPEGEVTYLPGGYILFCLENPHSIFCEERP